MKLRVEETWQERREEISVGAEMRVKRSASPPWLPLIPLYKSSSHPVPRHLGHGVCIPVFQPYGDLSASNMSF